MINPSTDTKRKSIKQQILGHLNSGHTLTYGQANTITNSQSGYRRFQEILKDDPKKYRFVKVKSENGGYYNVFAKDGVLKVGCFTGSESGKSAYIVYNSIHELFYCTSSHEKREALSKIKKVVR